MSRYDKETIRAKIEWEGGDGIEWFESSEVPDEIQDTWELALSTKRLHDAAMAEVYGWLDQDDEE